MIVTCKPPKPRPQVERQAIIIKQRIVTVRDAKELQRERRDRKWGVQTKDTK